MKEGVHLLVLRGLQLTCICAHLLCVDFQVRHLQVYWQDLALSSEPPTGHHLPFFLCKPHSPQLLSANLKGG